MQVVPIVARLAAATFALALVGATAGPASADGTPASAASSLELIVDGSGSMAAADPSGGTKIEAAKAALSSVADSLPAGSAVAVRAYGGRYGDSDPRACRDTRLVVPLGPLSAAQAKASVAGLQPLGQTPIAISLQAAAKDLGTHGSRTIVLISDGQETCGGKPCDTAKSLARQGVGLTVDTVGYGADAATAADLQCIAAATGGSYLPAADGPTLAAQLRHLSARALKTYEPEGTPVTGAVAQAAPPVLATGQYLDSLAGGQSRGYSLVLDDGPTAYVAATLVRPPGAVAGGESFPTDVLTLDLLAPDGTDCGVSERDFSLENDGGVPTTAVLRIPRLGDELKDACQQPGHYTVTVTRDLAKTASVNAALPLELRYVSEPAVTAVDGLPAPTAGAKPAAPATSGTAVGVSAGGSFNSAPQLAPGLYSDTVQPGETLFYRVHVDYGQQLNVGILATAATSYSGSGALIAGITAQVYDPIRSVLSSSYNHGVYFGTGVGTKPLPLHTSSLPVVYRNRDAGGDQRLSSLAGDYYVSLHVGDVADGAAALIPFRLAVQVLGTPAGAPTYTDAAPADIPTGTPAATPAPAASTAASATTVAPTTVAPTVAPTSVAATTVAPTSVAPTVPAPSPPVVGLSGDTHADHTTRTVGLAAGGALAILLAAGITLPLLRRRPRA